MKDYITGAIFIISCVVTHFAPITGFWWNALIFGGTWQLAACCFDALIEAMKAIVKALPEEQK